MGWLRKVGRKIGKRLNKIFGSKLGPVVGAIGMYMLMGPVAKTLTGWASSAFGGAGAAASGTAATTATTATQAATTAASDAAAAEAIAASGIQSAGASAKLSETALLAGDNLAKQAVSTTATNQTVAGQIANATNNMDVANSAISAIDSAAITGSTNVYPTITDSLINEAVPALDQPLSVVKNNLAEQVNMSKQLASTVPTAFSSGTGTAVTGTAAQQLATTASTLPAATAGSFATSSGMVGTATGTAAEQLAVTVPNALEITTGSTAATASTPNIFERGYNATKDFVLGKDGKLFGDDFVGDTVQGVATGLIMGELQGDYEEPFRSAGVASQPLAEAAQGNYIQAVAPSAMAATGMTRMPSFQELSQQTLYGTGSPNYLSQFYQPLATPQAIG